MRKRKFVPNDTTYTCKCGHRAPIPTNRGKMLCNWCGEYVFIDKKKEFEHRLIEKKNNIKDEV